MNLSEANVGKLCDCCAIVVQTLAYLCIRDTPSDAQMRPVVVSLHLLVFQLRTTVETLNQYWPEYCLSMLRQYLRPHEAARFSAISAVQPKPGDCWAPGVADHTQRTCDISVVTLLVQRSLSVCRPTDPNVNIVNILDPTKKITESIHSFSGKI